MAIRKIMVVDDSPTERAFIEGMLRKRGYDVLLVDNGESAIERAKTEQPDLILMDVVMPGLNGFQATRAITREEKTKHIPVIICTTKDQETDKIWMNGELVDWADATVHVGTHGLHYGSGVFEGIDETGALILREAGGKLRQISAGEVFFGA